MIHVRLVLAGVAALQAVPSNAATPAVLTNHLGYELGGPKRAVIQGHAGDEVRSCVAEDVATGARSPVGAPRSVGAVGRWRDWTYWTVDFSELRREGTFRLSCATSAGDVRSFPFLVQLNLLERHTLSNVVHYFKSQRASGPLGEADRALPMEGRPEARIDAHGGWYDASGDYGKHLSHLSFSTYFNPQQLPLTAWALLKTHEILQRRGVPHSRQHLRRLLDEGAWGADYLVRVKAPGGSFYRSVGAPGPEKRPQDRRIGRERRSFAVQTPASRQQGAAAHETGLSQDDAAYQVSFRAGGGMAIAALARAAALPAPGERRGDYLRAAEEAWAFLSRHNALLTNDGRENVVDDYCALLAATELFQATGKAEYRAAADDRAARLLKRLAPPPRAYWRADEGDRPFFHAADAGLPLVSLLAYAEIADADRRSAVLEAARASLEWELAVTSEVPNPFGYARQLVQTKAGVRDTRFFFPHDTETAPWWQGENARLGSLAFAARLALPLFAGDGAFAARLRGYAQDQLNWILGLNPFDVSMLHGTGRNNPEYLYFGSYEYASAPGGIVNGITSGFEDPEGIDFHLPHTVTGADHDWRWTEQWLPHATWYLLAVAAGDSLDEPRKNEPVIVAYVFPKDGLIDPAEIAARKLTHINYAFANVEDGKVVEGFSRDADNLRILTGLRKQHPHLKVLVSVGGWTWSGGFSDMALTPASRKVFVESAVAFVRRHDLDGFDVDWEYPGLPGYGNTHRPEDKQNFTALMRELRAAFDTEGEARGRRYWLTFAAGANVHAFLAHTEMDKVQAAVDLVNLMTYDFRESEADPEAGHHSNLYMHPADPKQLSADRAVRDYLAAGVPPDKLVLGVPFYGRAWGAVQAEGGQPLYRPGRAPAERLETGYGKLSTQLVGKDGFVRGWDRLCQAPYLWNAEKGVFVTYDDPESLRVKSRYVLEHGLAGVMFWQYYSDATGALLDALHTELFGPHRPGGSTRER